MRNLALAVIVIESFALIFLTIFAKVQYSRADINSMAAYKQQELLMREKDINAQLTEELIECQQGARLEARLEARMEARMEATQETLPAVKDTTGID